MISAIDISLVVLKLLASIRLSRRSAQSLEALDGSKEVRFWEFDSSRNGEFFFCDGGVAIEWATNSHLLLVLHSTDSHTARVVRGWQRTKASDARLVD